MKRYGRRRTPIIPIIVIIIGLLLLFILRPQRIFLGIEKGTLYVVRPVYMLIHGAAAGVGGFFKKLGQLPHITRLYTEAMKENAALKKQLLVSKIERTQNISASLVEAKVLGYSVTSWDKIVIIDVGKKQGVNKWMGVVTPEGVCGVVTQVAAGVAKVVRIDDNNSEIGATLLGTPVKGIVRGLETNRLTLEYIPNIVKVKVGDTVVTTGGGSIFPKGLVIGYVTSVKKYPYKTYQDIMVKTAVDLDNLGTVYVITSKELRDARNFLGIYR